MVTEKRRECHPLLRKGRQEKYSHGFSSSQMQSLSAICEAFLPPLKLEEHHHASNGREDFLANNKSLQDFYLLSGSQSPIPDEVAEIVAKRGAAEGVVLLKFVLWALGTRLGTLLLCGFLSLSWSFPFIHKFADLPLQKREKLLQNWSKEKYIIPLRITFIIVKMFLFYIFFCQPDENLKNPTWDAIGYLGPTEERPVESSVHRPLDEGVIETKDHTNASLVKCLSQKGLKVSEESNVIDVECDVVIVGSGCGGGVAAAVLAEAGHRVIVVEKGNYFTAADYSSLEYPSMSELYEVGGTFSTVDGKLLMVAGTTVGGGSAVNWSACIKTPAKVMKEWAEEYKISLFETQAYRDAMDRVWKRIGVTEECEEEGLQNKILRKGCDKLGYKVETVARNSCSKHYCGHCSYGCPTNEKRGTDTTWLVDAVRNGAVILTGCKAEKFLLESNNKRQKKKCIGVVGKSVAAGGEVSSKIQIRARVNISACGSLLTPPLLMASGLKNKHIGKNLRLHPAYLVWGYFPDLKGGRVYEGGIITSLHKVMEESNCSAIIETPILGPGTFSSVVPWVSGSDVKERISRYGQTSNLFALVRDTGSGTVEAEGRVKYRFDRLDKERLSQGVKRAMRILIAAGATEVGTHRSDGQKLKCKGVSEEEVEEFLDKLEAVGGPRGNQEVWNIYNSAHQMGSCRMGATDKEGAVDPYGETWEAQGLFVCDASALPTAVGVNPMITIQATAYCLATGIANQPK